MTAIVTGAAAGLASMAGISSGSFTRSLLLFMPCSEQATKDDQLAQVVCIMVSDKESLAKQVLTAAPAECLEEIGLGLLDESLKVLAVFADGGDGLLPRLRRG